MTAHPATGRAPGTGRAAPLVRFIARQAEMQYLYGGQENVTLMPGEEQKARARARQAAAREILAEEED